MASLSSGTTLQHSLEVERKTFASIVASKMGLLETHKRNMKESPTMVRRKKVNKRKRRNKANRMSRRKRRMKANRMR